MQKVVTIFQQKGGGGKSVTAVHLSFALARYFAKRYREILQIDTLETPPKKKKVLFLDADPQGTGSLHFLGDTFRNQEMTLLDGLMDDDDKPRIARIEPIIINEHLHLIPAHGALEHAEKLANNKHVIWQYQLKKLLTLYEEYEVVIIDTPGSRVSIFPTLAMVASQWVIIPVKTTLESQQATIESIDLIHELQPDFPYIKLFAIIPNQYENTRHHKETVEILMQTYPGKVYDPSRKSVKYADALAMRADIRDLDTDLGDYWDVIASDLLQIGGVIHE